MRCWSSLWTARAIAYRQRNGIAHDDVALAVVVQAMVESESFRRALHRQPADGQTQRGGDRRHPGPGRGAGQRPGGAGPVSWWTRARAASSSKTAGRQGAGHPRRGRRRHDHGRSRTPPASRPCPTRRFWSWRGWANGSSRSSTPASRRTSSGPGPSGRLYLLQSRAITSLYPLPAGMPAEPLQVLFSLNHVQGMLDPFTPLGQDAIIRAYVTLATLFGRRFTPATQREAVDRRRAALHQHHPGAAPCPGPQACCAAS